MTFGRLCGIFEFSDCDSCLPDSHGPFDRLRDPIDVERWLRSETSVRDVPLDREPFDEIDLVDELDEPELLLESCFRGGANMPLASSASIELFPLQVPHASRGI